MERTKEQIIALAEQYLELHQPPDYRMRDLREGVRKIEGTWYVVVEPSREDVKSYDFNARLAEAATELMDAEGVDVLLTTVLPRHVP